MFSPQAAANSLSSFFCCAVRLRGTSTVTVKCKSPRRCEFIWQFARAARRRTWLSSLRQIKVNRAVKRRHFYSCTERRFSKCYRNLTVKLIAVTLKYLVRTDINCNNKVTGRAPPRPSLPIPEIDIRCLLSIPAGIDTSSFFIIFYIPCHEQL